MSSGDVAISRELEALFLCARFQLQQNQKERLAQLLSSLESFDRLIELARSSFLAPIFYQHVKRFDPGSNFKELVSRLRPLTPPYVAHHLNVSAAQRHLVSDLFRDGEVDYAFFKGNALAAKFYPDPSLRYCRDIDVLIPEEQAVEVALRAQSLGYAVYPDVGRMSAQDLRAVMRYEPEIQLVSREGVLIELHYRIDRTGRYFSTRDLLSRTEKVDLGGQMARILPTPEHFIYLCLHHTRHRWSRLHWMVDMNCILTSPDYDADVFASVARSRKLESTLNACVEFVRACGKPKPFEEVKIGSPAHDLMADCVESIEVGAEAENRLKEMRATPDCAYPWQVSHTERIWYDISKRFKRLRPKYHHYASFRLPIGLHWVYFFTRSFRVIMRKIGWDASGKTGV